MYDPPPAPGLDITMGRIADAFDALIEFLVSQRDDGPALDAWRKAKAGRLALRDRYTQ